MLFNSFEFVIFLVVVFSLYWLLSSRRRTAQNFLILVGSYVFYGWWDWRFLSLIVISSIGDFIFDGPGLFLDPDHVSDEGARLLLEVMDRDMGLRLAK